MRDVCPRNGTQVTSITSPASEGCLVVYRRRPRVVRLVPCAFLVTLLSNFASAGTFFSGHVTDSNNAPVVGVVIEAGYANFSGIGIDFVVDGQATTDQNGDYAITQLDSSNTSGEYVLVADAPSYVLTVYPNLQCNDYSCLDFLSLPAYVPQAGVNFTLVKGVTISGTVMRSHTHAPVASTQVNVSTQEFGIEVATDESGNYSLSRLVPGTYVACICSGLPSGNHAGQLLSSGYESDQTKHHLSRRHLPGERLRTRPRHLAKFQRCTGVHGFGLRDSISSPCVPQWLSTVTVTVSMSC
jgi:hypothetical protein